MYVVNRKGDLISNYRKRFLFDNDKIWAKKGKEF